MQSAHLRFNVNLLDLLGQQYGSSEDAIKELIANAWDADATEVKVDLPQPLQDVPITIRDDGYGMSPHDIQTLYFNVGYDRTEHSGVTTPQGRKVRGSRGIGKFAGLALAENMSVDTISSGGRSTFTLSRSRFESSGETLDRAEIPIETNVTKARPGTTLVLSPLRQNLSFPSPERLSQLLLREYGVRSDFRIYIDNSLLTLRDISVPSKPVTISIGPDQEVTGELWISDSPRPVPVPGVVIRVQQRIVGKPSFFGLEEDPEIPRSIRERIYGEFHADHLKDAVLPNWSNWNESNKDYQSLASEIQAMLRNEISAIREREASESQKEFVERFREKIERLPPSRRDLARVHLLRIFRRFYDDVPERRHVVAEFVLNALEEDEYWILARRIEEASDLDINNLASVLEEWGIYELSGVLTRARQRLVIIEQFEALVRDIDTLELSGVHRALENNLWLLGDTYELLKSNATLSRIVADVFGKKFSGRRSRNRPDLFLAEITGRYVLVELKRPTESLGRSNIAQAQQYRDDLGRYLPQGEIDVVVIGGKVDEAVRSDPQDRVKLTTFWEVVIGARKRCNWLIENLSIESTEATRIGNDAA